MLNPKGGQTSLTGSSYTALANEKSGALRNREMAFNSARIDLPIVLTNRLKELSITTIQDLIGVKKANPEGFANLLRTLGQDESKINNLLAPFTPPILENFSKCDKRSYTHGAIFSKTPSDAGLTKVASAPTGGAPLPEVSLINANMSSIRDQGYRGTCVAFASCAVLEYEFSSTNYKRIDLSEQFQYWNCKQADGNVNEGTQVETSFALMQRDGCCLEETWLYQSRSNPTNPTYHPPPPRAKREALSYRAREAVQLTDCKDVIALKAQINQKHPVAIGVPTFDSWEENENCRLTGNISMPLPGELETAGHAMVLVGYGDSAEFAGGGFFIVRNSWGTLWAPRSVFGPGYGTIPYKYIKDYNQVACFVRSVV